MAAATTMAGATGIAAPMAVMARTASATMPVTEQAASRAITATRRRHRRMQVADRSLVEAEAAAEPAPLFENLSPGLLPPGESTRRRRGAALPAPAPSARPRTSADQVDSGGDNADAGEPAAAPADCGNTEPVIVDTTTGDGMEDA